MSFEFFDMSFILVNNYFLVKESTNIYNVERNNKTVDTGHISLFSFYTLLDLQRFLLTFENFCLFNGLE